VKPVLVDTDILSMFFRNNHNEAHFKNIEGLEILNWSKSEAASHKTG